jgi:hypothetical protein
MDTILDIQTGKHNGLALCLPYPVPTPLLSRNWLQSVRIWTYDLILGHAEDKVESLKCVLYFILHLVKQFVLYVPNAPVVLSVTRTAGQPTALTILTWIIYRTSLLWAWHGNTVRQLVLYGFKWPYLSWIWLPEDLLTNFDLFFLILWCSVPAGVAVLILLK